MTARKIFAETKIKHEIFPTTITKNIDQIISFLDSTRTHSPSPESTQNLQAQYYVLEINS